MSVIDAHSRSLRANYIYSPVFPRPWLTYARVEIGRILSHGVLQDVLLLSHYFLMTDSLANLELIGIIERAPPSAVLFLDDRFFSIQSKFISSYDEGCL